MKKIISGIAVAVLSLVLLAVTAPAQARSAAADVDALQIGVIGYNAYGPDTAANRNQEFVDLKNVSNADVDLNGLLIQDAWARGNGRIRGCNVVRFGADALPAADGGTTSLLPAGKTVRVHMGAGKASIDRWGVYHVYRDMPVRCGYNGHVLNNKPGSNPWAPWDTVWITLGGKSKSKSYNFTGGYRAF